MTEKSIEGMSAVEFNEIAAESIKFMKELIEKKGNDYAALVRQAVSLKVECLELQEEGKMEEAEELAKEGSSLLGLLCMLLGTTAKEVQEDAQKLFEIAEREVLAITAKGKNDDK